MREIEVNIWNKWEEGRIVCVLTNGMVNSYGEAVMGRGVALEAAHRMKNLRGYLGALLEGNGNHVFWMPENNLYTFPTKHNWRDSSSPALIAQSAFELMGHISFRGHNEVYLPRPGVGNGGLLWEDIKSLLEGILDDRVIVCHKRDK